MISQRSEVFQAKPSCSRNHQQIYVKGSSGLGEDEKNQGALCASKGWGLISIDNLTEFRDLAPLWKHNTGFVYKGVFRKIS